MSKAPKKIWADGEMVGESGFASCFDEPMGGEYTEYIRADLVDGLVEALEKISGFTISQFANTADMANKCCDVARAALKALEEE